MTMTDAESTRELIIKYLNGSCTEEELKRTIRETARRERVTFLISSHDLLLFEGLADRYLFLSEGRMIFSCDRQMNTEELKEAYARTGAAKTVERTEP